MDSSGQTIACSADGKSIFSAVGTSVVEINAKTGVKVGSALCFPKVFDEGLHASTLSLRQPARASCLGATAEHLGVGCTDGSLRVLSLPLGEENQLAHFCGHRGAVNAVCFSGTLVATGGRDTEIVVWDLLSEMGVCRLSGHKGEITSLSFLPSSSDFLVSGSKDGLVKVWSLKLQICVQTVTEAKSEVWSLAFHGLQNLIVGSSDKSLYVYTVSSDLILTADGLTVLHAHGQLDRPEPADGRVANLGVSATHLFAQTDRRVVEIWRIVSDEDEKVKRMKRRVKRTEGVSELKRAADEYVVAASAESAAVALRYVAHSRLKAMAVAPSGQVILGLSDNQIEMFKLGPTGAVKESRSIKREGHRHAISTLSVSEDSNRLLSVSSESLIVWNAVSLAFQKKIENSADLLAAYWVPGNNDQLLLVGKAGQLSFLDVNSGEAGEQLELWGDNMDVASRKKKRKSAGLNELCCVHQQGTQLVVGDKERRVSFVSFEKMNFQLTASFEVPDEPVSLAVSCKTQTYLAVGLMNANIEVIYSDTGKHFLSLYSHKLPVTAVAFSPDDQVLVSGSVDKNIKVWSMKFGNVLKSIRASDAAITTLSFIPHTHMLFSGSRDGVLSLWDIDRFERVLSKVNHPSSELLAFASSGDAGMIFTGGSDRAIRRITRSDDQMFIEEEAEKAMELEVEGEAQRDDHRPNFDPTMPTKSSSESVRLVERVVEMIEIDEEEIADEQIVLDKKKALVKFIAIEIPPAQLQQIIVSLPTGHARRLLAVIASVMEHILSSSKTNSFSPGFPVEACVSAGLFLIQAQAKYLIGEPHSRAVLLKLRDLFHTSIKKEIDNVGIAAASMRFL